MHIIEPKKQNPKKGFMHPRILVIDRKYPTTLEGYYQQPPERPEMGLARAIFYLAIRDATVGQVPFSVWRATIQYIARNDKDYFFSFNNLCDLLGYDTQYLKAKILGTARPRQKLKKQGSKATVIPCDPNISTRHNRR